MSLLALFKKQKLSEVLTPVKKSPPSSKPKPKPKKQVVRAPHEEVYAPGAFVKQADGSYIKAEAVGQKGRRWHYERKGKKMIVII